MSARPPLPISSRAARRFLIDTLGLSRGNPYTASTRATTGRVMREIRRLECVQLDPVAAVERNQHLVLAARVPGYAPRSLARLLDDRQIFEYWANAACVVPIEDYWMFEGVRHRLRTRLRKERALLRQPARHVLRELERGGPLPSRAFVSEDRIAGYWDSAGPKTKVTTHALNVLWDTGEVMVVHREGMERYFDLPEKVVPAEQMRQATDSDPREADRALLHKYLRAYRIFDLGDFRFGWQKIPAAERKAIVDDLMSAGRVVPLQIEGARRAYFALAEDAERLERYDRRPDGAAFSDDAIRFLAPLDNLLWRRERVADLFGFSYTWEIYTPAHKRRFGYYTMPILAGDRLIGRIDPRLDRLSGRLVVRLLHLEPEVKPTTTLRRSLRGALDGFAGFHGADEVLVEKTEPDLSL